MIIRIVILVAECVLDEEPSLMNLIEILGVFCVFSIRYNYSIHKCDRIFCNEHSNRQILRVFFANSKLQYNLECFWPPLFAGEFA